MNLKDRKVNFEYTPRDRETRPWIKRRKTNPTGTGSPPDRSAPGTLAKRPKRKKKKRKAPCEKLLPQE